MRVRVPVAVRNRLARLETRRVVDVPIGGWPTIMEVDAWEAMATRMQEELAASAHEDPHPTQPRFESVYSPPPERKADEGLGEKDPRRAIEDYLQAQQAAREGRSVRPSASIV